MKTTQTTPSSVSSALILQTQLATWTPMDSSSPRRKVQNTTTPSSLMCCRNALVTATTSQAASQDQRPRWPHRSADTARALGQANAPAGHRYSMPIEEQ
jgi:hypothetical protein